MFRRNWLILFLILQLFLISYVSSEEAILTFTQPDFASLQKAKVEGIIDGDTVSILLDGKQTTIRLIGVDTPETVYPQKPVEAYGKEASQFTTNLLKGEDVFIDKEPSMTIDKYGRTLLYLFRVPDGLFINLEIVRQGYGHAYTELPFKYMELFKYYEKRATDFKKGLWSEDKTIVKTTETKSNIPKEDTKSSVKPVQTQKQQPKKAEVVKPVPQPSTSSDSVIVYITKTGAKYHRDGCRYLSRSRIPISLSDAKSRGYSPCSVCDPPE